ncbi:serine carboxypeptidase s28 domain-containing protein [Ditylenchus destructor]|nr:serine carboxypeptidase s28 domain-containing protein [Ditylenchus destructor]
MINNISRVLFATNFLTTFATVLSENGVNSTVSSGIHYSPSPLTGIVTDNDSAGDVVFGIDHDDEPSDSDQLRTFNPMHFGSIPIALNSLGRRSKNFPEKLKERLRQRNLPINSNSTLSGYIVQYVDHFNKMDIRKWKQYFFYNLNYSKPENGLNFLHIGGEGPIFKAIVLEDSWMMMAWAKQYGAAAYSLEHRFYGQSLPTGFDHSVSQLRYLSSHQAISDIARFIRAVNRQRRIKDPKWIVFGGSYAGNLAAWLRQKYPNLVYGALSSSAPVRAVTDFPDYYLSISNSLKKSNLSSCFGDINDFFTKAKDLLQTPQGRKSLGICPSRWEENTDMYHFIDDRLSEIAVKVQGNCSEKNEITGICSVYAGLAENNSTTIGGQGICVDSSYRHYVNSMRNPRPFWLRSWYWQMCTEFGYFQTVGGNGAFGNISLPLEYLADSCADIFGPAFNKSSIELAVARTNRIYGGADQYNGTNVIFTHGSEDPWQALSVHPSSNGSYTSIYIEGTSHCRDLYPPTPADPASLRWARHVIDMELGKWIADPNSSPINV